MERQLSKAMQFFPWYSDCTGVVIRNLSRGGLVLVNKYEILISYPNKKNKNLKVVLNELFPNTMSNTIDKYIIISTVDKPHPCHPYIFIKLFVKVHNYVIRSPDENNIPKKHLDMSLVIEGNYLCSPGISKKYAMPQMYHHHQLQTRENFRILPM